MLKRLSLIALAILGLASCEKQEEFVEHNVPDTINISMEEIVSDTKVQLDEQMQTVFNEKDQISAFYLSEQNLCYEFTGNTGDRSGSFKVAGPDRFVLPTHLEFLTVYPYQKEMVLDYRAKRISVNIPNIQHYHKDSYDPSSNIMFWREKSRSTMLKNLSGYISFQLTGPGTIKSIKLKGNNDENISGPAYISVENELLDFVEDMNNTDNVETRAADTSREIILDCGEGVSLDEDEIRSFYFSLVPRVFSEGFTIDIELSDGRIETYSKNTSVAIRRNTVHKMAVLSDIGYKAALLPDYDPDLPPVNESMTVTDISATGTANCYIIPAEGAYKFKTVKGNSEESVGTVNSVSVLWESYGTTTAPAQRELIAAAGYKDGYISFQATDKRGNALIAAKDEEGKVLWSWHIWMTEQPEDQHYVGANQMMDRNLGATSATKGEVTTMGLLYQWGRKDPFLSFLSSTIIESYSNNGPASTNNDIWNVVGTYNKEHTIDFAVSHPTYFISTVDGSRNDWYYSDEPYDTRWTSNKTMYDPCPIGYRVPDGGENGVWVKALDDFTGFEFAGYFDEGFLLGSSDSSPFLTIDNPCYYPLPGYLMFNGLCSYTNTKGFYWSCSKDSDIEGDFVSTFVLSSDGSIWTDYESRNLTEGYSVRCQKII